MNVLFLIVFLDLIGFGMLIPVFPFFAERIGISPETVIFFGGLYSFGQLAGAPLWGALSDRIGRRPVLLLTLAANVLASLALAFIHTPAALAASRIISGLAAGNISTAFAYVSDVTDDRSRPRALGMLGVAFAMGFILGPALGGLLSTAGTDRSDIRPIALASAVLSGIALLGTFVFLRESLTDELKARAVAQSRAGRRRGELVTRPGLRELFGATLVLLSATSMLQVVFPLWAAARLGMGPVGVGYVYAIVATVSAVTQGGAIGPLTRRFGEANIVRASFVLAAIGFLLVIPSTTPWMTVLALVPYSIGTSVFGPSVSGMIAKRAQAQERGAALGVYQGAASLGRVVGPFTASGIAKVAGLSGPLAIAALISLSGLLLIRESRAAATAPTEPAVT
ncbi:MAG: MFS transporter [Gemmatimonadaceae bacterium]|jgi:MFS family permease|nr:MFS transporter [Gemmatimonadaceae bacterium]